MTYHPVLQRTNSAGTPWGDILAWINKSDRQVGRGYTINDQHLLQGPNVVTRLIPEATTQPKIRPWSAILHTNAGSSGAESLWGWITRATVNGESHLQVGYRTMEQYMPFNVRADCNYSANRWLASDGTYHGAISFETRDNGSATLDKTPWTVEQLDHMIGTLTALCVVYGVACTMPAYWNASGIGFHTLFPFQGIGSSAWTNVRGKTCPGAARKAQMPYILNQVAQRLIEFSEHTGWACRASTA